MKMVNKMRKGSVNMSQREWILQGGIQGGLLGEATRVRT